MKRFGINILVFVFIMSFSILVVHAQGIQSDPVVKVAGHIDNPFGGAGNSLKDLFVTILNNIVLPIGGVIAVLSFVYSGFLYVMAQGDEKKISTAHSALLYTAVGTAVLLGASVIAGVVENTINQLK